MTTIMRERSRAPKMKVAFTWMLAGLLSLVGQRPSTAGSDSLVVKVNGFRDDTGQAGCLLFSSSKGFPVKVAAASAQRFVRVENRSGTCEFAGLVAGTYAVAVFHDANSNGAVDTNFLGMPKEGIGVSRDARGFLGPPKFADAAFHYAGGNMTIQVTVHYRP